MKTIQDIATGALMGFALVGTVAAPGCGHTVQVPPQVAQNLCRLDALKALPRDPKMVTPYDIEDLLARLKSCDAQPVASADAGTP